MTQTATQTKVAPVAPVVAKASRPAPPAGVKSLLASFAPASSNKRVVSAQELADNCGIGSSSGRAWTAVHGHVFDITAFSEQHPGGSTIRFAAGRDSTCLLESYHPGSSMSKVEAALFNKTTYVGRLQVDAAAAQADKTVAGAAVYKRPDDAFFLDVRQRVEKLIKEDMGSNRYAYETLGAIEVAATLLFYFVAFYYVTFHGSWLATIALGILTGRMGFLMHMGNHCAISRSPERNAFVGRFMDFIGSNAIIWGYEHQVAHHGEPNEHGRDNDCEIGAPAVRMHPDVPHEPATMPYQHILIPIAMTIGFFKWYVGDFGHFAAKQVGHVRMAIDRGDWVTLLAFKGVWLIAHVALPVWYQGWGLALAQLFVFMALGGHYLENIFIVNHIQNGLVPPPDAHWAAKQVLATANWKSGSVWWNFVSGGLNHQVEHHMFPSLSQYWYPHISGVVRQCAQEHGLPYVDYPNFSSAWMAMWTYLRDVGQADFVSRTGQKGAPALPKNKSAKVHAQ